MELRHPEVLWAQRSDKVYLTIALPDAKNVSIKCEPEGLFSFSALGLKGESFDFSLKLYGNIIPESITTMFSTSVDVNKQGSILFTGVVGSYVGYISIRRTVIGAEPSQGCKSKVGLRNILCSVQKEKKGWWKRLLMSEEKPAPYLKVDWNKWCDEDEESANSDVESSDNAVAYNEDDGENTDDDDDDGMLYLPDLKKAGGH